MAIPTNTCASTDPHPYVCSSMHFRCLQLLALFLLWHPPPHEPTSIASKGSCLIQHYLMFSYITHRAWLIVVHLGRCQLLGLFLYSLSCRSNLSLDFACAPALVILSNPFVLPGRLPVAGACRCVVCWRAPYTKWRTPLWWRRRPSTNAPMTCGGALEGKGA